MPGHPLDTGRVDTDPQASGPVLTMPGAPPAFHLMAKPTGATCNLDCEYCFFLSKEMLYPGSRFRMAQDLQETYIRQLLEAHARAPEVVVAWQGGEPTMMGLDFFRRSIELQRTYARPGQRILNTMQTNGTLLTDEWGEFLKENDFLVGISIDGPPEMHDAYRVDKGGKPTSAGCCRGLDVLKRHEVDWNVLTTVHAVNGDHGREVYRFLRDDLGATFIQYIPIIERATAGDVADRGRRVGQPCARPAAVPAGRLAGHPPLGRAGAVRPVHDRRVRGMGPPRHRHRVRADVRHRAGQLVRRARRDVRARRDLRPAAGAGAQRRPVLLRPLRRTGLPAGQHQGQDGMLELVALPQQRKFGLDKRDTLTRFCRDCDVRVACNGGCPKDRFATSPYGEPGQHYLCPGYQAFFRHVREPMQAMVTSAARRTGRPPS